MVSWRAMKRWMEASILVPDSVDGLQGDHDARAVAEGVFDVASALHCDCACVACEEVPVFFYGAHMRVTFLHLLEYNVSFGKGAHGGLFRRVVGVGAV